MQLSFRTLILSLVAFAPITIFAEASWAAPQKSREQASLADEQQLLLQQLVRLKNTMEI